MDTYSELLEKLNNNQSRWLITGVAGFIGSNLLEQLLLLGQSVVGVDNFSTGYKKNLEQVRNNIDEKKWRSFQFIEGDISSYDTCAKACRNVDYVLHQAALGSVPRSIKDPLATNTANIDGFINMIIAAKDSNVKSFVYAASSSTYGDHTALPKVEENIGNPLSPYAVSKYVNELYADVFHLSYGFKSIGLRYFNVFGKRQDPEGAYAAVIPKWISAIIKQEKVFINGDGETSRDFCFIENVVKANLLAANADHLSKHEVFNIAVGDRTSLNDLFAIIRTTLIDYGKEYPYEPIYRDFRPGDVRHSQADVSKAKRLLEYEPEFNLSKGMQKVMPWYIEHQ